METLRLGSRGPDVRRLQARLKALGFPVGALDGDFGFGTEAAVRNFQRSRGLLADGVAGPRTQKALELAIDDSLPSVIPQTTPVRVQAMFPMTPRLNIQRNLPFVLAALEAAPLVDRLMVLMALATIRAETESFLPISEGISRFNTSPGGRPFDLYDFRTDLGNRGLGDGARYKGRGFVQLTGRSNYDRFGKAIGLGTRLITNPELANEPGIAGRLLARFLADKELAIKDALLVRDFRGARRLVNGGSHGLDRFTDAYLIGEQVIAEPVVTRPRAIPTRRAAPKRRATAPAKRVRRAG